MSFLYFSLLLVAYQAGKVVGYSSGTPSVACTSLSPSNGHGASTATGSPPFTLSLSASTYNPGDVVQVTLSGLNGATFKGFLIIGKQLNGQTPVGVFTATTGSKVLCPGNSGVTHTDNSDKTSVSFTWTAPSTPQGDVVFHYTVVRGAAPTKPAAMQDYFQDIQSVTLKAEQEQEEDEETNSRMRLGDNLPLLARLAAAPRIDISNSSTDNSSTLIPTSPAAPTSSSKPPSTFTKDEACGKTKGCYGICRSNNCDFLVSWQELGSGYKISLTSATPKVNSYIAFGFSNESKMNPASVLGCISVGSTVDVIASYNANYNNSRLSNLHDGLSNITGSYVNGILSCSVTRVTNSTNPQIFNLTQNWYLVAARGAVDTSGNLLKHTKDDAKVTTSRVNFAEQKDLSSDAPNFLFVKAYGCLMVIAWCSLQVLVY